MPQSGLPFDGKVAVVTGSTGGLGRPIAFKLARQGARVVINGRQADRGQAAVEAIRAAGGEAHFVQGDMGRMEDARGLIDGALQRFGQIDALVASAGVSARPDGKLRSRSATGPFARLDVEDVVEAVGNLHRPKLNPARAVVEHMLARKSGAILFLTSEGGRVPTPGQTAVSLHAGGLIMMTKVLAKELARSKVRVNTLSVTLVKGTPSWDRYESGESPEILRKAFDRIIERSPYGLASAENVADVAAFLVSDAAMFVTGATVSATGGATFA